MKTWICAILLALICTACASQDVNGREGGITMYGTLDQGIGFVR